MAFPSIPTGGRVIVGNQADANTPRTFPDLSTLTKNSGDLLIAIIVCYQSSLTSAIFSSWGASFTELLDVGVSTQHCVGIAYKWSDGTESGTFTVAQAGTITGHASMIVLSIEGAHDSTPPESLTALATNTTAAADPGSLDPAGWAAEDTLWISVIGSGMTSGTSTWTATGTTAPANYTNRVDTNTTDNSTIGQTEAAVAFRQLNASSEDVGTGGVDTSNARNCATVIAVRPAASTAHTVTPSDTLALADARALDAGKGLADTLALADARALAAGKGLADALALTDLLDRTATFERAVADPVALADNADPVNVPGAGETPVVREISLTM